MKAISKRKQFTSLDKFFLYYYKFFKNPILFFFFFALVGRYLLCKIKTFYPIFQKKSTILLMCCISGSSIYFESNKRAKDLSIYILGPTFMAFLEHLMDNLKIEKENKKNTRKRIADLLYAISFGLLLNSIVNDQALVKNSLLNHVNKLFPLINK